MADEVMRFLVASGGGAIDEIMLRVPAPPKAIANSLTHLKSERLIRTEGPKTIEDFDALVAKYSSADESDRNGGSTQQELILDEIVRKERGFMDTVVRPTIKGLAHSLT